MHKHERHAPNPSQQAQPQRQCNRFPTVPGSKPGSTLYFMTNFRDQARDAFIEEFGEPEYISVTGGEIYRWILNRRDASDLFITIDSPEMPDLCHIMISDPASTAVEPVSSMTLRTLNEIHSVIERVRNQWHHPASSHDAPDLGTAERFKGERSRL